MTENMRPLLWHQGLFLQPQHFQHMDMRFQAVLALLMQQQTPYPWGINKLKIMEPALQNRLFEVSQLDVVFQDGTFISFPGNAVIQPRSFQKIDIDSTGEKPFRVYLGLKKKNPSSINVTSVQNMQDMYSISTRYISDVQPEEVKDLHIGGAPAMTRFINYALKLFWETEVEGLGDYMLIPIAQLELAGDKVMLSTDFVPPAVSISGSDTLMQIIRSIEEQIKSRCRVLEMYKIHDVKTSDMTGVSIRYLLALSTVNRYMPVFDHLIEKPFVHPWFLYGLLRQLIGELSTFTDRINALGFIASGDRLVPTYNHTEIGNCFIEAQKLIGELLSAIVIGDENIIQLIREEDMFKGRIPAEAFSDRNFYSLAITTKGDPSSIINSLVHHAKLGSLEEMPTLLARALPGIALTHKQSPPSGLPKTADTYYFTLDANHPLWSEIRASSNICLYWDEASEDAKVELIISRA